MKEEAGSAIRSTHSSPCQSQREAEDRLYEPVSALAVSDDEGVDRRADLLAREAQHKLRSEIPRVLQHRVEASCPAHSPRITAEFSVSREILGPREKPASLPEKIDLVVPNLRDLALSSCLPDLKPCRLYRAARPFTKNVTDIFEVYVEALKIQIVIDLRDDDLTSIPEESESRLVLSHIFPPHSITALRPPSVRTEAASMNPGESLPKTPPSIAAYRAALKAIKQLPNRTASRNSSTSPKPQKRQPAINSEESKSIVDIFMSLRQQRPYLSDAVLMSLATNPHTMPLRDILLRGKDKRMLMIVNLFDTPAIRKRILMSLSNSVYAPVILFARATDKLAGTAMAPFYFCKYIMSAHDIYESYVEMINNCGEIFAVALKIIALAEAPVLFHCSLGKDRTGVLAMLVLSVLGAPDSAILFDYSLTERANATYQAYAHKFIMDYSGLSKNFCSATVETARKTLDYMKEKWGSVAFYLDEIGFGADWRRLMRRQYLS